MNTNNAADSVQQDVKKYVKRVYLDPSRVRMVRTMTGRVPVLEGDYIDYMADGRMLYNGTTRMLTSA